MRNSVSGQEMGQGVKKRGIIVTEGAFGIVCKQNSVDAVWGTHELGKDSLRKHSVVMSYFKL